MTTRAYSEMDEFAVVVALARRFVPHADVTAIRRVPEGVSTRVYRIAAGKEAFYLRVLPEQEASFAPEVLAHTLLRERGVRVPGVVYWEHRNPELGCSMMVTTEIPGEPLWRAAGSLDSDEMRRVLCDAGRDLAVLNGVPVSGFGWIRRDEPVVEQLAAERPTFRRFVLEHLDADLADLRRGWSGLLGNAELDAARRITGERDAWLDVPQGFLAHGDFDVTHIFVARGRYSGIIDLGEIRGADPLYDLAHFKLHDGERLPARLLPQVIEGYARVRQLPADYSDRLELLALLIGIRALARRLPKRGCDEAAHHLSAGIRSAISNLQK